MLERQLSEMANDSSGHHVSLICLQHMVWCYINCFDWWTDQIALNVVRRIQLNHFIHVRWLLRQQTCLLRRDSVLLNRLCIGHIRLTHSFLLSGDDLPECGTCQCPLTAHKIIDFIKETRFYKQL